MKNFSNTLSPVFAIICVCLLICNSGILCREESDLILFGGGCSPGLIKSGGESGGDVLAIPRMTNCKQKKMPKMHKVEYLPMPYPVKEYVPYPVYEEKPIIVEVEKKEMEMPHEMEMPDEMGMHGPPQMGHMDTDGMDYEMGMGYPMDTKKSNVYMKPITKNKENNRKLARSNPKRSGNKSENSPKQRSQTTKSA